MQLAAVCLLIVATPASDGQTSTETQAGIIHHLEQVVAACRDGCSLAWKRLADAQLEAGEAIAARTSIGRALRLMQGDSTSLEYATVMNTLALVEFANQQYARAERAWNRSLGIMQQQLGGSHPAVIAIWAHLALVRTIQQNYGDAERLLMRAIDASGDRAEAIEYRDRLARTYALAGRPRDAEEQARIGLELAARTVRAEDARALPLWVSLGAALASQRRYAEADSALNRALTLARKLYGMNHLFTGSVAEEYARVLRKAGRKQEAKEMSQAARGILDRQRHSQLNTVDLKELRGR
jgi:tetratricopeptide (TPR) repeat protein